MVLWLGFPHRGFPAAVENAILKGIPKRTQRAGLTLPPIDLLKRRSDLQGTWKDVCEISDVLTMSEVLYPDVFRGFMERRRSKGLLLRYLPTPVYFYAMKPGDSFTARVPAALAADLVQVQDLAQESVQVNVSLLSVGPLRGGQRLVKFSVNSVEHGIEVKDSTGKFVFTGPIADASDANQVTVSKLERGSEIFNIAFRQDRVSHAWSSREITRD